MTDIVAKLLRQRRRTELSDLEVDEVSLVDTPANFGAKILMLKRDDTGKLRGSPIMSDIYKSVLPDDLGELLERGTSAVNVEKAGVSPLQKVATWLRLYGDATTQGSVSVCKSLEGQPPSVNDCDRALAELCRELKGTHGDDHFKTYEQVITSPFGKQIYAHRDAMTRAGDDPKVFASHLDYWRALPINRRRA